MKISIWNISTYVFQEYFDHCRLIVFGKSVFLAIIKGPNNLINPTTHACNLNVNALKINKTKVHGFVYVEHTMYQCYAFHFCLFQQQNKILQWMNSRVFPQNLLQNEMAFFFCIIVWFYSLQWMQTLFIYFFYEMKSSLSEQIDIEIFQLGTKNKFFEKNK